MIGNVFALYKLGFVLFFRVFILLTAMGQRSLQGPSAVSIMESLLSILGRVLSPIMGNHGGGVMPHTGQVDLSLIGWILLFLCRNLDNTLGTNGFGEEEGAAKKEREQGLNKKLFLSIKRKEAAQIQTKDLMFICTHISEIA